MSSASIFESLRELFPQVDLRILRAISIEHRDDIDEAIEFILSEFSLAAPTTLELPYSHDDHKDQEQVLLEGSNGVEHTAVLKDEAISHYTGEAENTELHVLVSDSTEEPGLFPPQMMHVDANSISGQRLEASDYNNNYITHLSEKVDEIPFNNSDNQQYHPELHPDLVFDKVFLTKHHMTFSDGLQSASVSQRVDAVEVCQREDNISVNFVDETNLSAVYDKNDSTDARIPLNLFDLETAVNTQTAHTTTPNVSTADENDQIYQDCAAEEHTDNIDSENQNFISLDENFMEPLSNENDNSNILLSSLHTRSGHTIGIDLLEESIRDAKNSKKTLLSTLESMACMMQEVELLEEKAKQVKADNVVTNHDFLSKIEELQKTLKQSKDENDMHAGEVYGERSILAAEARELQSRLLKMSGERNEYLSITEEIFRALEVRKATAENEIAAAELEKLETEKSVHKSLKERESMIDDVRAESQKLQQEAEENSKLREFLMERGRAVDALQGEIAIICEDILSLKLKVNGPMPVAKYIRPYTSDHRQSNSPEVIRSSSSSSSTTNLTKEIPETHPQVKDTTDHVNLIDVVKNLFDDWELCET